MDLYKISNPFIKLIGKKSVLPNETQVIFYHDIVTDGGKAYESINIDLFKKQMEFILKEGYTTLNFSNLKNGFYKSSNEKTIMITFDDGYISNHNLILDFMKERNLKYNIFLAAGKINHDGYLTGNLIKQMSESSLIEFGAHTFSHIDSRKLCEVNIDKEIFEANNIISGYTNKPVDDFCLPHGFYNQSTLEFLTHVSSYKRLYTSDYMPSKYYEGKLIKGRAGIRNEDNISIFKNKLIGYFNILYELKYKKRSI